MISATDLVAERLAQLQAERRPGLSPSRVAACRRQSAYLLHKVPRTDWPDRSGAELGTIIHAGWERMLEGHGDRIRTEVQVPLSGPAGPTGQWGRFDWAVTDDDEQTITIGDLKTKNRRGFRTWQANGPDPDTWNQLHVYAAAVYDGAMRYALEKGDPPLMGELTWNVQIVAIERETGRIEEWTIPADIAGGRALAGELAYLERALLEADPDEAPQDGSGSGFPCDWCDWKARCWS
jgi:hypothetical protein